MSTEASQLESLKEQHEALSLRAEIKQLESFLNSADLLSRHVQEGWGDTVDRRDFLTDSPGFGYGIGDQRISSPADRKHGANYPIYQTEQDLAIGRGIARFLEGFDESTLGILENLVSFTVGTGFVYTAKPLDDAASELADEAQKVIDQFIDANGWEGDLEAEIVKRSHRDGEAYVALRDAGGGTAEAAVHEPEWITEPMRPRDLEDWLRCGSLDWKFGVASDHGRPEKVRGYFSQRYGDANDWECLDVRDVLHIKLNSDRGVKRGISDFYAAYRRLESASDVLLKTGKGAAIQSAIPFIREHAAGTTESQISGKLTAGADYTRLSTSPNGSTRTKQYKKYDPGTIIDTVGSKYIPGPMGQPNVSYIPVIQALLRSVGIRWNMPEYMVSGDASNANYSSTLISGGPFDRSTQRRQAMYKRHFKRFFLRVLDIAARYGRFRRWGITTLAELQQAVELVIDAPGVAIRNTLQEDEQREIQKRNGVLSAKTWAAKADLDYDTEVENGAKEAAPPGMLGGLSPNDPSVVLQRGATT